jgi:DNA-directed RNA polymerase specialized sigma subunit
MADKINYVDNKKLLSVLIEYQAKQARALEDGKHRPRIPEYVGECVLLIAERLSTKYQFANYQYREDMVMDGVENVLHYIDNFDPTKSSNPFSYFTQIIYYAFLRRIQGEKKHLYLKYSLQRDQDHLINNGTTFEKSDTSREKIYSAPSFLDQDKTNNFIDDFENYMAKKSGKKPKTKENENN